MARAKRKRLHGFRLLRFPENDLKPLTSPKRKLPACVRPAIFRDEPACKGVSLCANGCATISFSLWRCFALYRSRPWGKSKEQSSSNGTTIRNKKHITAFNISIKETYANGHVSKHEVLEEFLGKIIALKEVQGTAREANFREYYGDGMLDAGAVWDEKLPVQAELTDFQAVVDVVTYVDGTAESTNDDALGRIIEERQATVDSGEIAIEIIKSALADANDTTPAMTAARKIQDRAIVWKAQQHTKLELNGVYLESIANELKALSPRNVNRRDALQQIVNREEAEMSVRSVHAALVKTGAPQ